MARRSPSAARRWRKKRRWPRRLRGRIVIHTFEKPIKPTGGLVILKGNLAPEGCVMKIAAADRLRASRTGARVRFRRRLLRRGAGGQIKPGDVLVIRYEGPKGGPGMREMLQVTAASQRSFPSSAHTLRCSPMADSAARRADSPRATWLRKHLSAGRLPRCARATSLHFDIHEAHAERGDQRRRDGGAAQGLQAAGAALAARASSANMSIA